MKKAIGIDLGTTNSVVAFKDTAVKIIRNKDEEELTRSCVGLRKGEILVGGNAYKLMAADPTNTILSIKRLMGGALKDKMVQEMINSGQYEFEITSLKGGTDDAIAVVLGDRQYTPEQISSEILKKLKNDAAEKLGDEVTHAVITVPAYFTEKQKNATRIAAQMAGLKVQKLLAEPTAAAIAYGVDNLKTGDSTTVLIYDFGGGTFDLSILTIADGSFIEGGKGGDRWLGGDDLDRELMGLVYKKIVEDANLENVDTLKELIDNMPNDVKKPLRYRFKSELRIACEEAKKQLSSSNLATVSTTTDLIDENGEWITINVSIRREEFEEVIRPFIEKSIDLIEALIKNIGFNISMIDKILLVGGTSRIPLVQKLLASKYGANKIRVSEKPMLTVAEGAAILSHSLSDDFECPHCGKIVKSNQKICENCKTDVSELTTSVVGPILYTASHNYYVGLLEGDKIIKKLIIEKQTPLPVEETRTFQTTTNNQKIVKVVIYSEVENGETCRLGIGLYLINNSLPLGSEISFDFNLDTNENFHVSVYPKNLIDQKKQILIGRGGLNEKALKTMDDLIERSIKEFKKLDSEQTLLDYVSQRIKEIEESNPNEITDEKWAEIYYNSTEKFAEIQRNEGEVSPVKRVVNTAKALVVEFGDLLDPFDKSAIIDLIKQIESSSDDFEKIPLVESLEEKTDNYGLLNSVNRIPMLSERILNVPGTGVGTTNKAADINKLNVLYTDAKTKLKMGHIDEGRNLKDEAYEIIDKYKI